jgi:hypothetical protein
MAGANPVYASDMQIRPAIESDVPLLVSLNAHVHDLHVRAEPDFYRRTDPADVEARFREVLADEATRALLENAKGPEGPLCLRIRKDSNLRPSVP